MERSSSSSSSFFVVAGVSVSLRIAGGENTMEESPHNDLEGVSGLVMDCHARDLRAFLFGDAFSFSWLGRQERSS